MREDGDVTIKVLTVVKAVGGGFNEHMWDILQTLSFKKPEAWMNLGFIIFMCVRNISRQ